MEGKVFRGEIVPRAEFRLKLDLETVKAVQRCCERHYSPECVSAGRVGGFVYGWVNSYEYAEDPDTTFVDAKFHQLDILSKCIEHPEKNDAPLMAALCLFIRELARGAPSINDGPRLAFERIVHA